MFFSCLLLMIGIFSGTLLSFLFDREMPFPARLCMGTVIGLAVAAMTGYLFACILGLTAACIWLTVAVLLAPALLLLQSDFRRNLAATVTLALRSASNALRSPHRKGLALIFFHASLVVLFGTMFSFAIYGDQNGLYTGFINNIGDLPLHLQIINSFVHGNFPPQDPTFAGVRFSYPFLCDVLTAMLVRAGAGMISAMWLQGVLLAVALAGLMHYWTLLLTRSHLAGVIAVLLVFFSGGLGWSWMLLDLHNSEHGLIPLLGNLSHDYTLTLDGLFRWGNSLTTLFIPQRSILFGMPLAIVIFCQWWTIVTSKAEKTVLPNPSRLRMLAAGILAGMLPLIHAHTFLVVMGMGACLALVFRAHWRDWLIFFVPAALIAAPQVLWLANTGTIHAQRYIAWHPGWDHGSLNAVQFWMLNAGFFIPVLLLALLWSDPGLGTPETLFKYYLPFLLCFIVPNLISLAPWVWDNIKVLFYWYIASAPLVALLLAKGMKRKSHWRWISAGALATMVLAGALDILRVITGASPNLEYNRNDVAVAQLLSERSGPQDIVLNAPTWNSAVYLTGRLSVLGYTGWSGSRGLDYAQREADIQRIYAGAPNAEALLKQYHVGYVVVGPAELASLKVNEQFWGSQEKVAESGGYRLYRTRVGAERAGK